MDLVDQIKAIAARIPRQIDRIKTEEATKNAFIMPFMSALGYDIFDPDEVVPEYTADAAGKKGEKVDYAIMKDGQPIILIECKHSSVELKKEHLAQLYRYFSVTPARVGILTNGVVYRFYSDLEEPNKMDDTPFLTVNLLDLKEASFPKLKKMTRAAFDIDEMVDAATEMKYLAAIRSLMAKTFSDPDEGFVKYVAGAVYPGKRTKSVLEQFTSLTRRAVHEFIADRINARLNAALEPEPSIVEEMETEEGKEEEDGIVTTADELRGFDIVRAVLADTVDLDRVVMRDTKSYCGILLDDNNRKPICRLHFNRQQYYLGIFDAAKNQERLPIESVAEIFKHQEAIRATVKGYLS